MPAQQTDRAMGSVREEESNDLTEQKENHHGVVVLREREKGSCIHLSKVMAQLEYKCLMSLPLSE